MEATNMKRVFRILALVLIVLAAVAWSGVAGGSVGSTDDSGYGQFIGPPGEYVPIGGTPTEFSAGEPSPSPEGTGTARLAPAPPTGGYGQFIGPPGEYVPIGGTPSEFSTGEPSPGSSVSNAGEVGPLSFGECDSYGLCMWQDINYGGLFWMYPSTGHKNDWLYVGDWFNDRASSLYNRRTNGTLVSRAYPPSMPDIVCVRAGIAYADLTQYLWPSGRNVNDTISGFNLLTTGC